jgi:O-antigen/teichoic acid export membrane protein
MGRAMIARKSITADAEAQASAAADPSVGAATVPTADPMAAPSAAPVVAPSAAPAAPAQKIFAGAGWLALSKVGSQIFSWAGTFYVATHLSPSDYGLSNLSTAFTEFAVILTNLGIGTTLVQRQETDAVKADNLFTATLGLGVLLALSALGLAYLGAWYFRDTRLVALTQFTAFIYLLSSLTIVPYNFLNRDMRFRERGLLDMYSIVASISIQMVLARMGFGVWTLLWGSAVRFGMRLGLAFWYSGYRPRLRFSWALLKDDIAFSARLTLNWLLFVLKERSIPILIGRSFSIAQLGLLGFAGSLSGIPNLKIVQLLREVLLPLLSKRNQDPAAQLRGLRTALKMMTLLILPIYLCGWHYGVDTLSLILPERWVPMFPLFEALCLVQLWTVLASIVSIYNTAQGKPGRSTWYEGAMAICIPIATLACLHFRLIQLAHIWSAVGAGVFFLWFIWQFRTESALVKGFLGQVFSAIGVSGALFVLDSLAAPHLPGAGAGKEVAWAVLTARIALFCAGYALFLRLAHWEFLKGLRRK